jgi:hypothetical protein
VLPQARNSGDNDCKVSKLVRLEQLMFERRVVGPLHIVGERYEEFP